jgi:hypothetical protein
MLDQLFWFRQCEQAVGDAKSLAYAKVIGGQDIGAAQLKDQEHLHSPTTYTAHLRKARDNRIIIELANNTRHRYGSVLGLGRKITQGSNFRAREADTP